ncbi:Uncharacterised protein [Candidatus Bilamarchaeum dharawalense]|uniref:Signal peptidase I n=1 Tax=Candidatus Bilamarchaeum dharawalense TaxID=2885759 RepID=A0A5E4LXN5_9ARCH|nr:Uncharacterised protein [Candidatus Bilamarchaeum dharawalense]
MLKKIKDSLKKSKFQIVVLFATLALFLITNFLFRDGSLNFIPILIAILVVIEIVAFVGMEVKQGAQKHGWKHEIVDTIIALAIAVAIWFGLSFVLNTSSPISGVVSCSMLPNLQRGDFVVVQGAPVSAHEINMSQSELNSLTQDATIFYDNKNITIPGSIFSYCVQHDGNGMCNFFVEHPENLIETKGVFTYKYERCSLTYSNGTKKYEPCLKSVTFKGTEYLTNFSNDVIVYQPPVGDIYSLIGDIVHRAFFKINVDGKSYYLTRGDNNPILDLQVYDYTNKLGNSPIPQDRSRGKVILRIPYLGYFKLFISGYLKEDAQCKTQLEFSHS